MAGAAKNEHGLTAKQEKFVQAYMATGCLTDAYKAAYNTDRMKEESIHVSAHRVAALPHVGERIRQEQAKAAEKHEWDMDRLVKELTAELVAARAAGKTGDALMALKHIGTVTGLYTERQHNINEDVSEAHIMALMGKDKSQTEH